MKFLQIVIFQCILTLGLFILTPEALAKDYSIPTIQVEVQVNTDGTITVSEHRTYIFEGSYSWANYRLPKKGFSGIRDIRISDSETDFVNLNSEEPQTFLVEESDEVFNIKWFFDAEDESRTFTVTYTLEGALTIGPQWSEFFWNYAASGREKSTDLLEILLELPNAVADTSLHSWVREPAWAITSNIIDNGFRYKGMDISRNQAVRIRTVFPTAVLDRESVQITDPDFSLEMAAQEELQLRQERIEAAKNEERNKALATELSIILAGLSIIAFLYFYRKFGTRHKVSLSVNNSIMLPGRQKPAAIGWLLMNRTVGSNLIFATLLDLARRNYFSIKENEPEEKGWLSSKTSYFTVHPKEKPIEPGIPAYEKSLLAFVNEQVEKEGNKMEEIFNFGKSGGSKWFYKWKGELEEYCKSQEWIDPKSYTGLTWNIVVQSILLIGAVVGIFLLHPLMFIGMGVTFISLILSLTIVRRTPKGEELYRRWKNYTKALQNAHEYSISEDYLGLHFIYAIAFGMGKKPVETMFEQHPGAAAAIYWIVILPGMNSSPANIASSFSNLAATGSASAGGGSFGGGTSAGVAGGGASGGAG
ncbi:DUF2207 domain-containing protein [Gracilimonas tropica]|uniref:DUF2207 domain-containing protein n=1 Tax=Gracilimonas tropica TaxID=454600 RepID=UPI00037F8160|nr:DUF2207 domain-containing protein [Gracilimonas tropica]